MSVLDSPPAAVVAPDDVLDRDLDDEALLRRFPLSQWVKGLFLGRFRDALAQDWPAIEKKLESPPRAGRYLPFHDYPLRDLNLLLFATARRRHPRVPLEEGVRKVGREDVKVVLESLLGRVVSAAVRSPREALLAVPGLYRQVVTGPRFVAEELSPRSVRLTLSNAFGPWGYQVGQLQGAVEHFGGAPTVRLSVDTSGGRRFDVSW